MSIERGDIEQLGYRIVATTKHPTGVSFDAYRPGFKKLVRGEVMPTYHLALYVLYERITGGSLA